MHAFDAVTVTVGHVDIDMMIDDPLFPFPTQYPLLSILVTDVNTSCA